MPDTIINAFNAGELSPYLDGRVDLEPYYRGCKTLENMCVLIPGGVTARPGTEFIAEASNPKNGAGSKKVRMVPFEFSTVQAYVLEFGDNYIRFYKDGARIDFTAKNITAIDITTPDSDVKITITGHGYVTDEIVYLAGIGGITPDLNGEYLITKVDANNFKLTNVATSSYGGTWDEAGTAALPVELTSPYAVADLFKLQFQQSADVLYITHSGHTIAPYKITRTGDTAWTIEKINFTGGPFLSENTDLDISITPPTEVTDETGGKTYAASSEIAGQEAAEAFDDSLAHTNGWLSDGTTNQWVRVDLGVDNAKTIRKVRIQPCQNSDWSNRNVKHCKIEASNNATDWTKISVDAWYGRCKAYNTDEIEIEQIANYADWAEVDLDNAAAYRYWRIYCYDNWGNANYISVKEVEMLEGTSIYTASSAIFNSDHVGALWQLKHEMSSALVSKAFTAVDQVTSPILVQGGWRLVTHSTWTGRIQIQRSFDNKNTWQAYLTYTSAGDVNYDESGEEEEEDVYYRVKSIAWTSGTCDCFLSVDDSTIKGIIKITEYISSTQVKAETVKSLGNTTATSRWAEGAWSDYRGYPGTMAFYQERTMWGGNAYQPQTIWGSKTGEYENMAAGPDDDDALIYTISSNQVNTIRWIVAQDVLLIGTQEGEWKLRSESLDEPLTPTNVRCTIQSNRGSAAAQAYLVNDVVLFLHRSNKKLYEFSYSFEEDIHRANEVTIRAGHITGNGISILIRQQCPDSVLWGFRDDGVLPGFTYERNEAVVGWYRYITDGVFESGAVIPGNAEDEFWVSVKRTIGGVDHRYIERFKPRKFSTIADAFYVDCGVTKTGEGLTKVTGLGHLEGKKVAVFGDGATIYKGTEPASTVASGEVNFPANTTADKVHAGLPYDKKLKTMRLSIPKANIQGKVKRISEVTVRFVESQGGKVGTPDGMQDLGLTYGTDSEDKEVAVIGGHDTDGYVLIEQPNPEPLTILALMPIFVLHS